MRKKRWAAALAAALCVLMLAGCKGKPLPDGMEEDAVLAAGEAVVQQLTDGDYSAVLAQFRSDIREGLTAEQIQTQVETAQRRRASTASWTTPWSPAARSLSPTASPSSTANTPRTASCSGWPLTRRWS